MKKMTISAMTQANGGKKTKYYCVKDTACGHKIYVKSLLAWNAHCRRQGHMKFLPFYTYDDQSRREWKNRIIVYI